MSYFKELDQDLREIYGDEDRDGPELDEDRDLDYESEEYLQDDDYDDSMDGDPESALASAGWGTDEDYGYYGEEY